MEGAGLSGAVSAEDIEALKSAYANRGWTGFVELVIGQYEERAGIEYISPIYVARLYALLGRHDEAFKWLELAYEEHAAGLGLVIVRRAFDVLHADPRWSEFLGKLGLEGSAPVSGG